MPDYIKVNIGVDSILLDKLNNGKWHKQIRAPDMPGNYKMTVEIGKADGSILSYEPLKTVDVLGKCFDLGQYGKLNEVLIKRIVLSLSGYASHVLFSDSTVYVLVRMSKYDASVLKSIEEVLSEKTPAHLNLCVKKYYASWADVKNNFFSWNNVAGNFSTWQDVLDYVPKHLGTWANIKHDFNSWDELLQYADWHAVIYQNAKDYAIWNEIKTGCRTWSDVRRKYDTWDDVQIYKPVEPLREGL